VGRLRWSQGHLLGVPLDLLACLTQHVDLVRQRFLDHFSQIFQEMPAVEDLLGVRCSFCGSFPVTSTSITCNHLDSGMPT